MQHYFDNFFAFVENYVTLNETDKALIKGSFVPIFAAKDSIIEPAGQVPVFHNFIVSGHLRNYHLDADDNEITTDLNEGQRLFTSYFHFMNQTVSNEFIQCITDCELLRITFADAQYTGQKSQTQGEFTIKLFEKLLADAKQRNWDMANLTAEKRYHKFAAANPNILKNVPLSYIASYLGITQRHLSRIRNPKS
jgi:CRP/FNR family transcriptional regulator, anaerobic regulatory protein